ncbi:alcaligin biosynthesis protein [Exilibacterium tricleocarpae]|uniref:Alcaligin biosynthesis protein n=1 Tax=Exilibacterium tricleocarpae TaxID=2591008 RepID=A0A545U5H6_9GAMM|nr:SidA/IucD/PvdA family monooxygenase [Exilibacterium tricleocarpae]TQV84724.1 alcaligin biosynthesis protein [Exilibacterium tricleocarpae]
MSESVYDFVAIGLGPFNLGLACLTEPIDAVNGVFLERHERFDWHPGMMLERATLQTPFLSDLVTLADPTHPLSFLNYIKQQGRIYSFYIREDFFLVRSEYNQYCQWAADKLSTIEFGTCVDHIDYCERERVYIVRATCAAGGAVKTYRAKKLVLGTGPVPYVPECCQPLLEYATHSSDYLANKKRLQEKRSVTILGSGQSAAEIYYDLLQDIHDCGYELNWVTRSPRYFPLEYSKLTLEMTSPEYVDYFYSLPAAQRTQLVHSQKSLYKGINSSLINEIYDLMYVKRLHGELRANLLTNSELIQAEYRARECLFDLTFQQREQGDNYRISTAGLVLATGYTYRLPDFLAGINRRIRWDSNGRFDTHRNYTIDRDGCEIFVQNAELHTHGFVTPDLGMACYRNAYIIREITGVEHYPLEQRIAFQRFAAPLATLNSTAPASV